MTTVAPAPIGSMRERNRRELTRAIVTEAGRQLAIDGAAGLSLRSVSRELGLAPSAIYRYVASRDDLLTLLIVEVHDAMATTVERAVARSRSRGPDERFRAFALALRRWSLAHPHEYALAYGSPVPGYHGPAETTRAATRLTTAFAGLLAEAADPATDDPQPPRALWPELTRLLAVRADAIDQPVSVPRPVLMRGLMAWVELFGLISFELSGPFANSIKRSDQLYLHAVNLMIADLF